jgi:hypothetical protein
MSHFWLQEHQKIVCTIHNGKGIEGLGIEKGKVGIKVPILAEAYFEVEVKASTDLGWTNSMAL